MARFLDNNGLEHFWAKIKEKINTKQDVISDIATIRSNASSGAAKVSCTDATVAGFGYTKNTGTYSKPSGGIPKSDLSSDVQSSLEKEVFVVEYGVTPFADIKAAHLANKVCVIFDNNRIYHLVGCDNSAATFFSSVPNGENRAVAVTSTGAWMGLDTPVILKSNISTEISTDSTDNQVASAKAVYDYIQSLDAREVSY